MSKPVVYDKAKYHYGGDFPAGLPVEQAFVHTGMYLGWIIDRELYSDLFVDEAPDEIARFKAREITGPGVYELWDGAVVDDMLNDEGNAFSRHYFDLQHGRYLKDYEELLLNDRPTLYHVEDSWANYDRLKERIDQRYEQWKRRSGRPWWQFWRR